MRTQHLRFRLTASVAIAALLLGNGWVPAATAQSAPGPAIPGQPAGQGADPPSRVGRLARITGTVSFRTADADHWDPASLNYPITSANDLWTEPQAEADVDVAGNRLVLAPSTEFDVNTLDDHALQATEPQGATYLRLRQVPQGDTYTVATPRGTVAISGPGRFEVVAGDTQTPTTVTVIEGAAQVTGQGIDLNVGPNQTATISGSDTYQASVGPAQPDPFLAAMLAREQPAQAPAQAQGPAPATAQAEAPPVVQQMTGAQDLAEYGAWQPSPQYGQVWYPRADPGYVPYRDGHWAYVAPWGWTWVDNAPWGFAPSHYGRWVQVDDRWGWTPGYAPGAAVAYGSPDYVAPVYAPAVVGFFGVGAAVVAGAAVGLAAGFALGAFSGGSVGWCPLGFNQPYYPSYGVSNRAWGGLNGGYVQPAAYQNSYSQWHQSYVNNGTVNRNSGNTTNSNNTRIVNITNNYAAQPGATVAPVSALTSGQPVAAVARAPTAQQVAQARPIVAQQAVQPTRATPGVTPKVAQTFRLPPSRTPVQRVAAPGPVATAQAAARPGAPPVLRAPAASIAARPGLPAASASAPATPRPGATPVTAPPTAAAAPKGAPGPAIVPHGAAIGAPPALRAPAATAGRAPLPAAQSPHPGQSPTPAAAGARPPGQTLGPIGTAKPGTVPPATGTATPPRSPALVPGPAVQRPVPQAARPLPQVARPVPQAARPQAQAPVQPRPQAQAPRPQVQAPVQPRPQVQAPRPQPQPQPQHFQAPRPQPQPRPQQIQAHAQPRPQPQARPAPPPPRKPGEKP